VANSNSWLLVAGDPNGNRGSVDGTGAGASFDTPAGITFDRDGQWLYICEWGSYKIRRVNVTTGVTETVFSGLARRPFTITRTDSGATQVFWVAYWDTSAVEVESFTVPYPTPGDPSNHGALTGVGWNGTVLFAAKPTQGAPIAAARGASVYTYTPGTDPPDCSCGVISYQSAAFVGENNVGGWMDTCALQTKAGGLFLAFWPAGNGVSPAETSQPRLSAPNDRRCVVCGKPSPTTGNRVSDTNLVVDVSWGFNLGRHTKWGWEFAAGYHSSSRGSILIAGWGDSGQPVLNPVGLGPTFQPTGCVAWSPATGLWYASTQGARKPSDASFSANGSLNGTGYNQIVSWDPTVYVNEVHVA
jgi:hypothetical protein